MKPPGRTFSPPVALPSEMSVTSILSSSSATIVALMPGPKKDSNFDRRVCGTRQGEIRCRRPINQQESARARGERGGTGVRSRLPLRHREVGRVEAEDEGVRAVGHLFPQAGERRALVAADAAGLRPEEREHGGGQQEQGDFRRGASAVGLGRGRRC